MLLWGERGLGIPTSAVYAQFLLQRFQLCFLSFLLGFDTSWFTLDVVSKPANQLVSYDGHV